MATRAIIIRDPAPADEAAWRALWAQYNAFYEVDIPEAVTTLTWRRLLDPAAPMLGRLALAAGEVSGFSNAVLHESTWTLTPVCYLEDLFVAPAARGQGVGRALIQDLLDGAKTNGWSRLYWHTRASNTARRLYDEFAVADDFVRYRRALD
jgi:GNAT superfamily N-acetyltransferase